MRLLFDTESNGFVSNATKLHCIGTINVDTGERKGYKPTEIDEALAELDKADMLIGHNVQRHDLPLLKKLKGFTVRPGVIVRDTMVSARLIFPNVKASDKQLVLSGHMPGGKDYQGKHTIAAWGVRLGIHKGDYAKVREAEAIAKGITDREAIVRYVWGEWNQEMHDYMMQDCETNYALWKHLRVDDYSGAAMDLEHRVAHVCDQMEQAGVPFDLRAAGELQANLVQRKHELETKLKEHYGFWYQPVSPDPTKALFVPKRPNKKTGYWGPDTETWTWTELVPARNELAPDKWVEHTVKGYPCTKIKRVDFNPGSRDHIAKVLIKEGWEPTKFTDGGKPQIDEETIEAIVARFPDMDGLGDLLMVEKRLSQLCGTDNSLMQSVKEDGRIHGVINPMGTVTSRGAHMYPNLGQVPSAKKPYGMDFRKLFMSGPAMPKGWVALGADQEGLELRGLAHYLYPHDKGKYADIVCDGDPHWLHACVMGLADGERDKHNKLHTIVREDGSKRFIYAYIYGCFDTMAGSIIYEALLNARRNGGPEGEALYAKFFGRGAADEHKLRSVGKTVRDAFLTRIEGFDTLKRKLSAQIERTKQVPGLDGRRIPVRSEHSSLNFLIQSAGAIICKRWLVDAYEECCRRFKWGWDGDFVFTLWVHDEVQLCVRQGLEEEIGNILVQCARKAGEPYGFRVRLDSKSVVGKSWADTH